jgi:hypothetical protein
LYPGCNRLANFDFLTSTAEYKTAHPNETAADASKQARTWETGIFDGSTEVVGIPSTTYSLGRVLTLMKLDYHHRVNTLLEELRHEAKHKAADEDEVCITFTQSKRT